MPLWLLNMFGWMAAHWRTVAILAAIGLVALSSILFVRSCLNKPAKLNETEIQRGEQAVKENNDKELKEIVTNSIMREKIADEVAANGTADKEKIIQETNRQWANANREDLQAEFDRRKQ